MLHAPSSASQPNPLHLVLCKPLFRPVVELGRSRALMSRHFLRVLERPAVCKVSSDSGGTERVWQPISAAMPAAAARRRIIRQASGWLIGLSDKVLPLCPRAVRNSQPLRSSTMPSASI
jgi:hypothetical protein